MTFLYRSPLFLFVLVLILWAAYPEKLVADPIVNTHSGLCLEVEDASQSNGASIIQNTCTGADNQDWTEVSILGGFALQVEHSGQCVDVSGGSTASGADLIQWPCNNANNQTFNRVGSSLQVAHSLKCVDIVSVSVATRANAQQWDCNGTDAQLFSNTLPSSSVSALFRDDFESGLQQWAQSDATYSGIGTHTSNSSISSLFLHGTANTVTSRTIDAGVESGWAVRCS